MAAPDEAGNAALFLDGLEAARRAPVVDEHELARLRTFAHGGRPEPNWASFVVFDTAEIVAYGGIHLHHAGIEALGDVAIDRSFERAHDARDLLVDVLDEIGEQLGSIRRHVWVRQVHIEDRHALDRRGFEIARELDVLQRDLQGLPDRTPLHTRPARPDDAAAIVDLLDAAYTGTADGSWSLARFNGEVEQDWFRWDDILLHHAGGRLAGIHWTKRRSKEQGEVHNLAVHPHDHGRGLGKALLLAGLHHLRGQGCDEAILWVDRANEAAEALYRGAGFEDAWVDACFLRVGSGLTSDG